MNLLLVTMIHTGTRFFVRLISEATGEKPCPPYGMGQVPFAVCHIAPRTIGNIEDYIAKHAPLIVVTERDALTHQTSVLMKLINPRQLYDARDEYRRFRERYDPLVLSFDAPDRDEKLQAVSKALGVELKTDWLRQPSDHSPINMGSYNALSPAQ